MGRIPESRATATSQQSATGTSEQATPARADSTGSAIGTRPTGRELRGAERAENFPVAMRLLPGRGRRGLRGLCGTVRPIDDPSDRTPGDATAALHALRDDLDRIWTPGPGPAAPVLRRLAETVRELG